jgi:hypothetical protein
MDSERPKSAVLGPDQAKYPSLADAFRWAGAVAVDFGRLRT